MILYESDNIRCMKERREKLRNKQKTSHMGRFQKGSFPYSGTEHTPLRHVSLTRPTSVGRFRYTIPDIVTRGETREKASERELEETHRSLTACALRERQLLVEKLSKQISQVNQMNQGTDQATGGGSLEAAKRALEEFNMQLRFCIF